MQQVSSFKMRPQRLIETRTGKFADFSSRLPPPYAILSHRWLYGEEVDFNDYLHMHLQPATKKKLGYRKIVEACKKAAHDHLEYIWIDTCCIDQSDHNEVARNVKSMYSYYYNSEVCYVYLADVQVKSSPIWRSEWFQRGWTLQELVAPRRLNFFKADWEFIGDRYQLTSVIHYLTGISPSVLNGSTPIHSVDIRTRMSWCAGRKTTKAPDLAYCLLGILGVSIDPDYTEDVRSAFKRLQKALVRSYPDTFKTFEDAESIYQTLVRQNARVRVGTDQLYTPQVGHAVQGDAEQMQRNADFMSCITFGSQLLRFGVPTPQFASSTFSSEPLMTPGRKFAVTSTRTPQLVVTGGISSIMPRSTDGPQPHTFDSNGQPPVAPTGTGYRSTIYPYTIHSHSQAPDRPIPFIPIR